MVHDLGGLEAHGVEMGQDVCLPVGDALERTLVVFVNGTMQLNEWYMISVIAWCNTTELKPME
jgi:hypothetical protein